ncbi:MAG: hypothetical protein Q9181_002438 [Wetmoreana brouardii]
MAVDYLLKPAPTVRRPRRGAGTVILIVYACLLLLLALTYFRLTHTVITNPGFTPRSPQWHAQNRAKRRRSRSSRARTGHPDLEKQNGTLGEQPAPNGGLPASPYANASSAYGPVNDAATPGLQEFYKRDVFTCESDGRPIWCSTCFNWKPDRAHHCREVGSATLFSLFLLGMSGSSLQFVFLNTTTIENLSRRTKVWQLAIHMPHPPQYPGPLPFRTVTYGQPPPPPSDPQDPTSTPPPPQQQQQPVAPLRTFAILHSRPGENPWDLGYTRNFISVMGEHWYDWFLPLRHPPSARHDRLDCEFETGPVVERMKREAGIIPPSDMPEMEEKPRRHRRRRRRRGTHRRSDGSATEGSAVRGKGEKRRHGRHHRRRRSESGVGPRAVP